MREEGTVIVMTDEQVKAEIESSQKMRGGFMKPPYYISYPNGRITPVVPPGNVVMSDTNTYVYPIPYPTPEINQDRMVRITAAEMRETGSRKEFRKLLGDRLNGIYQDLLQIWEREHPEAGAHAVGDE